MIILWLGVGIIVVNVILTALALWAGAKLLKTERRSFGRAAVTALIVGVLPPTVQIAGVLFHLDDVSVMSLFFGVALLSVVISWAVIAWMYGLTTQRAVALWLATFVPLLALTGALLYVVEPYVAQAYVVPSHSMAPTLLGPHLLGECPDGTGAASVPVRPDGTLVFKDMTGVCHATRQEETVRIVGEEVQEPDRFLVNKLAQPRRWDVIVFHGKDGTGEILVKRLVGLPGETVEIKGGSVWIDGEELAPPAGLAGLRYGTASDDVRNRAMVEPALLAGIGQPVRLGEDELYVLGDFSTVSTDSREFGPISRSDVIGVAEFIYWPVGRWQLLH